MINMKRIFSFIILLAMGVSVSQAQIQVLTGPEQGTYRVLADDMNKILPSSSEVVDGQTKEIPFLDVRTTAGSSINYDLLVDKNNKASVAFLQLDILLKHKMQDVLNGTDQTHDLMVLMPLSLETIHLVAKQKAKINSLLELDGMRVGIGNKYEGTYYTASYIKDVSEVEFQSKNISTQDIIKPLLFDKVDAFFVVASTPMEMLKVMPTSTGEKFKIVSIENINGWADGFTELTIPAGTYSWLETDVHTYGIHSVVVVNMSKISDEEKQALLQWRAIVIENLLELQTSGHSAWKQANVSEWDTNLWPQM
jgi:TRAP transporter TAXI family solute receptor